MSYGEYRSARAEADALRAWAAIQKLEFELKDIALRDWWGWVNLAGVAPHVLWVDRTSNAVIRGPACAALQAWSADFAGMFLLTQKDMDLVPLADTWGRKIAGEVAYLFEQWAEVESPAHVGLTHKLLASSPHEEPRLFRQALELKVSLWRDRHEIANSVLCACLEAMSGDAHETMWCVNVARIQARLRGPRLQELGTQWTEYVLNAYKETL